MKPQIFLLLVAAGLVTAGFALKATSSGPSPAPKSAPAQGGTVNPLPVNAQGKVVLTDAKWREILTPEQFRVLREEGTERAFTGALWDHHAKGTYVCAACGLPLFSSDTKFESGTGWPSFFQPLTPQSIGTKTDWGLGMKRVEVHCARCGGHLGHVFDDGPKPTGLRYCMNSVSLKFVPAAK